MREGEGDMQRNDIANIDEKDITILKILLKNARTNYKKIAEACQISPPAVTKRIENLRIKGIITGTRLITSLDSDFSITAVVGLNIEETKMLEVKQTIVNKIRELNRIITVYDEGIGYYNAIFGLVVKNINEKDKISHFIEGLPGVKKVDAHLWIGRTHIMRDNLTLK